MKNRIIRTIITMVLVVSTVIFTAGRAINANAKTADKTYSSKDGWTVKYDPSVITVNESRDGTTFVYNGNASGTDRLTISYKEGILPEKALDDLAKGWGNEKAITSSESYFPGTTDKWGYWKTLITSSDGSSVNENAFAGQYNNGVLVFDMATHYSGRDDASKTAWMALQNIENSITYASFAPQTMYNGMAGSYVLNGTEMIEGREIPVQYTVTLNEDHSGSIRLMGDEQYVMWGTHSLIQADNSYDYSTDGHTLNLNVDGNWLTFTK